MRVSDHAAIRWLERVEGFNLDHIRAAVKNAGFDPECDGYLLHHLWKIHGISVESIADRIATPIVMAAIKARATQICVGQAVLRISPEGCIVTVITPEMKQRGLRFYARRSRPDTRREQRLILRQRMEESA